MVNLGSLKKVSLSTPSHHLVAFPIKSNKIRKNWQIYNTAYMLPGSGSTDFSGFVFPISNTNLCFWPVISLIWVHFSGFSGFVINLASCMIQMYTRHKDKKHLPLILAANGYRHQLKLTPYNEVNIIIWLSN